MYDAVTDLRKTRRFFSLRTKFVLFISLIIVAVCSTLSWYFIEKRREFMTDSLTNTGRILAENLAYNSRNAVILEDQENFVPALGTTFRRTDVRRDKCSRPATRRTRC